MGKATNFNFGRYIHRVHPNKSPLKIWEKSKRRCIQGLPKFFEYPYYLKFCTHIHGIDRNKSPLKKISAKVAVGVLRDSQKFSGNPYRGRIAQSSLRYLSFLVDLVWGVVCLTCQYCSQAFVIYNFHILCIAFFISYNFMRQHYIGTM